jgi:hypothetical protein
VTCPQCRYFDAESGFFENWNRFYDPFTGRCLQPEPLLRQQSRPPSRVSSLADRTIQRSGVVASRASNRSSAARCSGVAFAVAFLISATVSRASTTSSAFEAA